MSLTKCLQKLGIEGEDAKTIRASVKNYLDEGMSQDDAAVAALEGFAGELQQSREDIVKQIPVKDELHQEAPTETEAFKKWFGDSKVVDENGDPLVVFHGTNQPVESFDLERLGESTFSESSKEAIFFSANAENAAEYAKNAGKKLRADVVAFEEKVDNLQKQISNAENVADWDKAEKLTIEWETLESGSQALDDVEGQNIIPAYIALKNPLVIDYEGRDPGQEFVKNKKGIVSYLKDAKSAGNDGVILENINDSSKNIVADHFAAFKPEQIKSQFNIGAFDPTDPRILYQDKRGAITFPAEGISKDKSIISLLEDADLSTFLHETGHFFFEVYRDIAADPNAPEQIRADMSGLLDFVGVDSLESWNSKSIEERRAGHEKVAEAFEVYLFEGKAPTTELQSLFQSFRAWLKMTYRSMTQYLSPDKITPEVRQVFDRMLATDEAIADAEKSRGFAPLFTTQEEAGATDKQWAEYQENLRLAHEKSVEEVEQKGLKDMKWLSGAKGRALKKLQAQANAARKVIKDKVTEEMNEQTAYRAMHFLRKGYFPGEEVEGAKPVKLDSETLKSRYPDLPWQKLSRMKLTSKEGVDPDNIAEVLGFTSGDEMVRVLIAAPSLVDSVNMETNRRMIQEHGELSDKEALDDAANIAVHSAAHARFLASEGKFLAKLSKRRAPDVRLAKETATKIIAQTKVANIRPARFEQMERKESKAVIEAWKKNKPAEASDHAQKQLLNFYLAKYAREAKVESEKILKHAKKYQKSGVRKSLRGEHLEQLDALLARFDFRRSTAPKSETAKRREQNLQNYLETESERIGAAIPDIAPWILDESHREHYSQLTMEEMRGLYDTFRQLDHLARRENKMYIESRNMSFQQEEAGIVNEFRAIHPEIFDDEGEPIPFTKGDRPYVKELKDKLKSKFDAEFVNMENLLDVMTVGRGKQIFSSLFGRLSDAADSQTKLMKDLAKFLEPYTTVYSIKERATFSTARTHIPEVGKYLTRDQMISVALNYGNEEGRQRLMEGHKFTDGGIKAIISHLDARDMAFVDALWRMSDEIIWPKLEALDKRTKGIAAKKVEPIPYVTAHGEARGGYVPLVYDGDTSTRSYDINTDQSVQELLGGSVRQAATLQGASKERVAKVNRELDLSISAISYKINETVHDVTHREAVADTWRLLRSDGVSTVIRKIGGPDVLSALMERVRETAVKPIVPRGIVEKGLWYLRKNTLVNMMGASFNTIAINILGAAPAIRRVGGGRYLRMIQKLTSKRGVEYYKEALEKSPYMAQRIMSFERDMSTEINRFVGREGLMPSLATWFIGLSIMDRMVTMPAWMAAYEIGLTENNNNEQDAVEFADRVIRQTQGSGRVVDLAKVAGGTGGAGEFKRIITMFYSFFNAQLGQMVRSKAIAGREWSEKKRAKAAMRIALDTFAIIIVPAVLEALARGQCKDDEFLYCAGQKSAMFTAAFFPIMRDVVPFIWSQYDPDLYRPMRISPIESALETMGRTPKAVTDIAMGEATEADYRTLVRGLGYGLGLPGFQSWRTIDGYQALVDGETDNPAVLLTGPPYK